MNIFKLIRRQKALEVGMINQQILDENRLFAVQLRGQVEQLMEHSVAMQTKVDSLTKASDEQKTRIANLKGSIRILNAKVEEELNK